MISRKRVKPFLDIAKKMLGKDLIRTVTSPGGKHFRLVLITPNQSIHMTVSVSPSDHRALANWKSQLRQKITESNARPGCEA
jgi:hypothetical protein